jgi:20S proteasome alpha/beta subunit
MQGNVADLVEHIRRLARLDAHSHWHLQTQSSTIDIRLNLMSLVVQMNKRDIYHLDLEWHTCNARSRSDLVATNSVGIWSRLYCCCFWKPLDNALAATVIFFMA